jgi:predicted nucleic acid-binding Zn ribbon protein
MRCPDCDKEIPEGARFCPQCGRELREGTRQSLPRTSLCAILSLVLGIVALNLIVAFYGAVWVILKYAEAFLVTTIFCEFAAVVLGIVALSQIGRSRGEVNGKAAAIAGIMSGFIAVFWNILIVASFALLSRPNIAYREAGVRAQVARVNMDMRVLDRAIESYYTDYKSYPAWAKGAKGANSLASPRAGVYHIPTFRVWKSDAEKKCFFTLTSPISYVPSGFLNDPFADTKDATFGYYSDGRGWILWSWGPDRDENKRDEWDLSADVEKVYRSDILQPSLTLLAGTSSAPAHQAYTYDPTNGTISPGDVYRVKQ